MLEGTVPSPSGTWSKRAIRAKAKRDAAQAKPKELSAEERREAEAKAAAAEKALLEEEDRAMQAASSKRAKKKKKRRGEGAPVAETTAEVTETTEALQGIEISDALIDTASVPGTEQGAGSAAPVASAMHDEKVLRLADLVCDITDRAGEVPESSIGGQTTCIVCMAGSKSHLAVPCGHQSVCANCSALMQKCPYCREPVQQWILQRLV